MGVLDWLFGSDDEEKKQESKAENQAESQQDKEVKEKKTKSKTGHEEIKEWPYLAIKAVMSVPEQELYWKLKNALPDYLIGFQVQASRVLRVKKGYHFGTWYNRINRLSYDFIVCDKTSRPIAIIELDDKSHDNEERQETDEKKNGATEAAGLKIYRWRVKQTPTEAEIKEMFKDN